MAMNAAVELLVVSRILVKRLARKVLLATVEEFAALSQIDTLINQSFGNLIEAVCAAGCSAPLL